MAKTTKNIISQEIADQGNWRLTHNVCTVGFGAETWIMKKKKPDRPTGKTEESAFIKAFESEQAALDYAASVGLKIKVAKVS
jgi:hypothetical protein